MSSASLSDILEAEMLGITFGLATHHEIEASSISIKEKKSDGASYLELKFPSRTRLQGGSLERELKPCQVVLPIKQCLILLQTANSSWELKKSCLRGHIQLNKTMLEEWKVSMHEILQKSEEVINKKKAGHFKKMNLSVSECSSVQDQSSSKDAADMPFSSNNATDRDLETTLDLLCNAIYSVLLETVIKGNPRIRSANVVWNSPDTTTWIRRGEWVFDITVEKSAVMQSGDAWSVVIDSCLSVLHLIDTKRSIPYSIKQVQVKDSLSSVVGSCSWGKRVDFGAEASQLGNEKKKQHQQQDQAVLIFVKTLRGKTISFHLLSSNTIHTLKTMIEEKEGIPQQHQRLSLAGKDLQDSCLVSYYKEYTLHLLIRLRGGAPGVTIPYPIIAYQVGVTPVIYDYENASIAKSIHNTEEAMGLIAKSLERIGITSRLKFYIYVGSPKCRIKQDHLDAFTSGDDKYCFHMVYKTEAEIPGDRQKAKSQIADDSIYESLKDLLVRVRNGEYMGRQLVLISGDKGFRQQVNELRDLNMDVVVLKPGFTGVFAELTSEGLSANIGKCFMDDPNWQVALKKKIEIRRESTAKKRDDGHLYPPNEEVSNELANGSTYKKILSQDPSFTLESFAEKFRENIKSVVSAYRQGDGKTLKKYWSAELIEECKELADFKGQVSFCQYKVQNISKEMKVEKIEMVGNKPTMTVTFHTKETFYVQDKDGNIKEGGKEEIPVYYKWETQQGETGVWLVSRRSRSLQAPI